jgi:hypothetical protein
VDYKTEILPSIDDKFGAQHSRDPRVLHRKHLRTKFNFIKQQEVVSLLYSTA